LQLVAQSQAHRQSQLKAQLQLMDEQLQLQLQLQFCFIRTSVTALPACSSTHCGPYQAQVVPALMPIDVPDTLSTCVAVIVAA
jgi:hypothetical protein